MPSFLSKVELKYQLQQMGIKVEGNYVRKRDIEKIFAEKPITHVPPSAAKSPECLRCKGCGCRCGGRCKECIEHEAGLHGKPVPEDEENY